MLMQMANCPKPTLQMPTLAPFCVSGSFPRADTITIALFMDVCRIFTMGMPASMISIA